MKLGWLFFGALIGAGIVFWFDHKETIKAIYTNRGVIDKGVEAAQAGQTLVTDLKDILTQVRQ